MKPRWIHWSRKLRWIHMVTRAQFCHRWINRRFTERKLYMGLQYSMKRYRWRYPSCHSLHRHWGLCHPFIDNWFRLKVVFLFIVILCVLASLLSLITSSSDHYLKPQSHLWAPASHIAIRRSFHHHFVLSFIHRPFSQSVHSHYRSTFMPWSDTEYRLCRSHPRPKGLRHPFPITGSDSEPSFLFSSSSTVA